MNKFAVALCSVFTANAISITAASDGCSGCECFNDFSKETNASVDALQAAVTKGIVQLSSTCSKCCSGSGSDTGNNKPSQGTCSGCKCFKDFHEAVDTNNDTLSAAVTKATEKLSAQCAKCCGGQGGNGGTGTPPSGDATRDSHVKRAQAAADAAKGYSEKAKGEVRKAEDAVKQLQDGVLGGNKGPEGGNQGSEAGNRVSTQTRLPNTEVDQLDWDTFVAQNKLRSDPGYFVAQVENQLQFFESQGRGAVLGMPGVTRLGTNEGPDAWREAVRELKAHAKQPKMPDMAWQDYLYLACRDHVAEQGPSGATGHNSKNGDSPFDRIKRYGAFARTSGENLSYGAANGEAIVMQLYIDDGVASRGHRKNLMNTAFTATGIANGPHQRYRNETCFVYSGGNGGQLNANGERKMTELGAVAK